MKIEWVATDRFVPGLGTPKRGETLDVDKDKGEAFINEGLAQRPRKPKTTQEQTK